MGLVNDVFTDERLEALAGRPRDRPRPLLDRGRHRGRQRAAHPHRVPPRAHRARPQRQPGERGHAAPRAGGGGLDLPVHLRHRGHPPPLRAQPPRAAGGRDRGQPVQGDGRLLAALPDARRAGGRARSLGLPAARDRAGWRARPSSPPRPARSTSSTPSTCATSSRARWSSIDRDGLRSFQPVPARAARASASSSTSTSRGPTAWSSAATCWTRACALGRQLAREAPADADVVVPVPDSGMGAALGYAQESGLPVRVGPHPQPLRRAAPSSSPSSRSAPSA